MIIKLFFSAHTTGGDFPPKEKKMSKKATNKQKTEGANKLPAGTPKAKKNEVYTATKTQDPPVPNRAHTEM